MNDTLLDVTGGLPYSRRIRVKGAVATWSSLSDFEVRSQVRASPNRGSTLKAGLSGFITPSIDGQDIVLDLHMTGSQTRFLSGGYYDVVLSDRQPDDARGILVLKGQLRVAQLVTGG